MPDTHLVKKMRLYKCDECGAVFDIPGIRYEHHTELAGMPGPKDREELVCPVCESDYITEGHECVRCGGFVKYGDFCTDCLNELDAFLDKHVRQAMNLERDELESMIVEWIER